MIYPLLLSWIHQLYRKLSLLVQSTADLTAFSTLLFRSLEIIIGESIE